MTFKATPITVENKVISGMEVICPEGLGRLRIDSVRDPARARSKSRTVYIVDTYVCNRSCEWALHNLIFINPVTKEAFKVEGGVMTDSTEVLKLNPKAEPSEPVTFQTFFATLSQDQGGPGYILIHTADELEARSKVHSYTNGRWAFMYTSLEDVHPADRKLIATL